MNWKDLKKLDIEDIVKFINEQIAENGSLTKASNLLGANESTIRKYIKNKGYIRVGNKFVLSDYICNSECNTQQHLHNQEQITQQNTDVMQKPDFKENIIYLSEETETIKDIIKWFKSKDDKSNTDVIEINEGINIALPPGSIKRTTIRINETVWDMFNKFVDEKKVYDKHDLMGAALLEYMEKYKD